jgi:DNA repair protein RadC
VASVRPHLRAIIARALQLNASAMIAAHNHPSGVSEPSESDRLLTRDLMVAALALGLKVLDHVIISKEGAYSFADNGLLVELSIEAGVIHYWGRW